MFVNKIEVVSRFSIREYFYALGSLYCPGSITLIDRLCNTHGIKYRIGRSLSLVYLDLHSYNPELV